VFLDALLKYRDPFAPFIPFLKQSSGPDDGLPLIAALVLTKILSEAVTLSSKSSTTLDSAVTSLYAYLSQLSKSTDAGYQDIAAQSYSALLRTSRTRELFWEQRKETVKPLFDILVAGAGAGDGVSSLWSDGEAAPKSNVDAGIAGGVGIQLMYRVLLVIWQLSFEGGVVGEGLQK
jgi:V-type H+-transporting ATPase subunit H